MRNKRKINIKKIFIIFIISYSIISYNKFINKKNQELLDNYNNFCEYAENQGIKATKENYKIYLEQK